MTSHPLPQGGEGDEFKTVRRLLPMGESPHRKCRNSSAERKLSGGVSTFSLAPLGERGDRKAVGEGVGRGMKAEREMRIRPHGLDPLTRLAPAEGSAGDEPPSPPRGRGR